MRRLRHLDLRSRLKSKTQVFRATPELSPFSRCRSIDKFMLHLWHFGTKRPGEKPNLRVSPLFRYIVSGSNSCSLTISTEGWEPWCAPTLPGSPVRGKTESKAIAQPVVMPLSALALQANLALPPMIENGEAYRQVSDQTRVPIEFYVSQ